MKIKTTKQMVEVNVQTYIACDGTEFTTAWQCEEYERKLREKDIEMVETNDEAKNFTPLNGCEFSESNTYRWFRPKDEEQVILLNEFFQPWQSLTDDDIGKWICIESDDEETWVYRLDESIDHIEDFLSKFGYKITIEKETEL